MEKRSGIAAIWMLAALTACAGETARGTAAPIFVDAREGGLRTVAPVSVVYSAGWAAEAGDGSYVVIETVRHAGMFNEEVMASVTKTAAAGVAFADGEMSFGEEGDIGCVRLVHRVFSAAGEEIGTPLARDVMFGVSSAPGDGIFADCRTNALQAAVEAGARVDLTYDTSWETEAAALAITAVKTDGSVTRELFKTQADAVGVTRLSGLEAGYWNLYCTFYDAQGGILGEPLAAACRWNPGFLMMIR